MAVFEDKKLSNDIIINDIMSDDEVVASDVPPTVLMSNMRDSQVVDDFRQATFSESRVYISALPLLF